MPFRLPTEVHFGQGAISNLPRIIEELPAKRPLLVSDQGVAKAGHVGRLLPICQPVDVLLEIEPNPRHSTINRLAEKVRSLQPDLVIGLGGGSVLDAAKALALLLSNPGRIEDYEGREKYHYPPLPILAIPTTCGTGSEVTWVSVITHTERRFKMSIKGKSLFPKWALVDPDLLLTLPPSLIASTGLDALTHAIEAAIVKPANPFSDMYAREAISLIFDSLPRAYHAIKEDQEAREKMLLGSLLAGVAFCNSDVGAVHCLAEALGGIFDLPHGVANAVFLPYVLEFMVPAAKEKIIRMARWAGLEAKEEEAVNLFLRQIKDMAKKMNIPSLSELKIKVEDFPEIARRAAINNSNPSNPRLMGEAEYIFLLNQAYS